MTQALEGFLQALTAGLLIGAIYGLMCVGLGLIFGVVRVINFAQGDFMMLGMYAAFYFFTALGVQATFGNTFGPFVAILLAGPLLAVFGYAIHLALISRVSGMRTSSLEGEGHYAQLILTLGIALILQNGGLLVFGSVLASIRTPLSSSAWELGPMFYDVSVFINKARGIDAVVAFVTMILLTLLITQSRIGKSLRAAADNPTAATYMGIDVDRAHRIAFALGTGITAIAGGLLATNYPFHPFVGVEYVKEPGMTQNAISTYGDMWVIKDALEKVGKADRVAVGEALRSMDAGPSKYYPLGEIKFDEKGRRVGAGMNIVQWQSGVPVTVFPPQLALAQPFWPKN